jgi:hypothetical protein
MVTRTTRLACNSLIMTIDDYLCQVGEPGAGAPASPGRSGFIVI